MDVIINMLRSFAFFFDSVVYSLIPIIYKLFIYLAGLDLGTLEGIEVLINRVYILLGIFMLFKISFSLLQYLIDPNSFNDGSKGLGKLVTNLLVALVLLVMVPTIFSLARDLQNQILKENLIGSLITGKKLSENSEEFSAKSVTSMAKDAQFLIYGAFFSLNTKNIDACDDTQSIIGSDAIARNKNSGNENGEGKGCLAFLAEKFESDSENMKANGTTLASFFKMKNSSNGERDNRDFTKLGSLLWWKENGEYAINYLPVISTAVGIYVVFILFTFSIDVAIRVFKLCFLQMLAPIAIVSYVDPKESASNSRLGKWVKESLSTWASLFLRLAILYLVITIISVISSSIFGHGELGEAVDNYGDPDYTIWIYLFLVIGLFLFAKQIPKIIEKIFNISSSGELNMNPFKNTVLSTVTGTALGGAAGAWAGASAGMKAGVGGRGAVFGALSGMRRGGSSKLQNGMFGNIRQGVYKEIGGSELAVHSPYEFLMKVGSKKKMEPLETALSNAKAQQQAAQQQANNHQQQAENARAYLNYRGVDFSNLPHEQRKHEQKEHDYTAEADKLKSIIASQQQALNANKAKAATVKAEIDRGNNDEEHKRLLREWQDKVKENEKSLQESRKKLEDTNNQITESRSIVRNIQTYTTSSANVVEFGKQAAAIGKDIKVMESEEKQRRYILRKDESPTNTVNQLIHKYSDSNGSNTTGDGTNTIPIAGVNSSANDPTVRVNTAVNTDSSSSSVLGSQNPLGGPRRPL